MENRETKIKRLRVMGKPALIYEHEKSEIPEVIRISFEDGHTAKYVLHIDQPAPIILENIRIIRKWKVGYPPRRRARQ